MLSLDLLADLRERRVRDAQGLAFVEGLRFLACALKTRQEILGLVVVPSALSRRPVRQFVRTARAPVLQVSRAEYRRVSLVNEPPGLGVLVRQRWETLPRPTGPVTWLAFDRVRSPGNLGTTLRTAAATGAAGALFLGHATDPYDPGAVRASMGAVFRQRLVRLDADHMRAWKRRTRTLVVGASSRAHLDYRDVSYRRPVVLMMGCERKGLSRRQRLACDRLVRIPMRATVDSLNVSTAAALMLYEVYRQRE